MDRQRESAGQGGANGVAMQEGTAAEPEPAGRQPVATLINTIKNTIDSKALVRVGNRKLCFCSFQAAKLHYHCHHYVQHER